MTFDEFLTIPPCTIGKHTTVDDTPAPVKVNPSTDDIDAKITAAAPVATPAPLPPPVARQAVNNSAPQATPSPGPPEDDDSDEPGQTPVSGTTCKRRGCNVTYKSGQSREDEECIYHPGIPIFHEGSKGYSCCKKRVLEFDDFMRMPGCTTKAKHLFIGKPKAAKAQESLKEVRTDFYQTATTVIASLFLKKIDKDKSTVTFSEAEEAVLLDLHTSDQTTYNNKMELYGPIIAEKSSFKIMGTKLELTIAKADGSGWPVLRKTDPHTGEIIQAGRAGTLAR